MSASRSRIIALANQISTSTAALDKYHKDNDLPSPSFDEDASEEIKYPADVEKTREAISDACQELNDLVNGPRKMMQTHLNSRLLAYDFIHRFQVAQKVPIHGKISYTDLARSTGVSETVVRKILRYAMTNHLFSEPEPGFVSHSAASKIFAEDQTMIDWIGAYFQEVLPALSIEAQALARWPAADEPSECGYTMASNSSESSFFMHMAKDPERMRQFASAMSLYVKDDGFSLHHLVDNYPWATVGSGTVVDMGGSTGGAAFAVAEKFPDLHFVVQDLPNTISGAKEREGVNVTFIGHDFFDEQPVKGADMYMSRWCLHNWPDKHCVKVLKALILALKPGARILIMDAVVPEPGVLPNNAEFSLRQFDVNMMTMANAGERGIDDWRRIFENADSRFKWKGMTQPVGSNLALIEAVWAP